jgi:hypothetical protein
MIPDAGQWDYLYGQSNDDAGNQIEAFFDSGSSNYIGNLPHVSKSIAGHSYWTDKSNSNIKSVRESVKSKADQYGLGVHQTEWSMMEASNVDGLPSNWDYIDVALNMAKIIHSDMVYANAASWSYWTAMYMEQWSQKNRFMLVHVKPNDNEYANNYTDLETEGPVEAEPTLWTLGNYSFFVRPGYRRIALTGASDLSGLMGTAYLAPDNSKIVAVYVNMGNNAHNVQISFSNLPGGYEITTNTAYLTAEGIDLKKVTLSDETYSSGNALEMPARSVMTVVYELVQPIEPDPDVTFANALGDFETIFPEFGNNDNALSEYGVADNPDKNLNHTSKVLYGKVSGDDGNWYGGLEITLNSPLTVTNDTRYLHIFTKTTLPYFELLIENSDQKYTKRFNISTDGWFDYVVDLQSSLINIASISYLRFAISRNETNHRGKEIWVDEIVANNDPNPRSYFAIDAKAEVAGSLYRNTSNPSDNPVAAACLNYHNDIVFYSTDDNQGESNIGQITSIPTAGLTPAAGAVVRLKKTVTKKWYPVGFPFELAGVYADLLNVNFGAALAARYAFDGDLKNEAGVAFEGFPSQRGAGTAPVLATDNDRPGSSDGNKVLNQSSGATGNESLIRFNNPLQGANTDSGFTVSLWVKWGGNNGDGCIAAFIDPKFGRLFITPNSGLAYDNATGTNGFSSSNFAPLESSAWKLLTLTVASTGAVLYVDGEVSSNLTWKGTADYSSLLDFVSTIPYFYLGYGSGQGSAPLLADDLLFYKKALDGSEVSGLYNLYTDIYENSTVEKYGVKLNAYNGSAGDFWLQEYNGANDEFQYVDAMEAGKGYVIQFPDYFNNKEITFVSENNPVLKNTTSNSILNNYSGYGLVANPSVANITSLSEIGSAGEQGAYYVYDSGTNNFGLVSGNATFTIKPFESIGIALAYEGQLRSSLGSGAVTRWDRISGEDDPVVQTRYYNLQGIEIGRPPKLGVYIEKRIYASQKVEVYKFSKQR